MDPAFNSLPAGLQIPTCRANPLLGAKVNVLGTLNVFEASRLFKEKHVRLWQCLTHSGSAVSRTLTRSLNPNYSLHDSLGITEFSLT